MTHLRRIRVLDLCLRPDIGMDECLGLVGDVAAPGAAPQLDVLKLAMTDHFGLNVTVTLAVPLLPASLTSLTLRDCVLVPLADCPPLIHLTHFCLEEDARHHRRSSGGIPLYDALDKVPSLTHFTFRHGTYDLRDQAEPLPRAQPVHLPHLEFFDFYGTSSYYLYILPNLSFPPSVVRNIHLGGQPPRQVPFFDTSVVKVQRKISVDTVCTDLSDAFDGWRYSQAMARTYQALKFSLNSVVVGIEESLQLKGVVTSSATPQPPTQNTANPELTVLTLQLDDHSDDIGDVLDIFGKMSDFLPTHIVDSFHFETNIEDHKLEMWQPSLLDWEEVIDVKLEGTGAAQWLIPCLMDIGGTVAAQEYGNGVQGPKGETEEAQGLRGTPDVFPKLANLSLHRIRMKECRPRNVDSIMDYPMDFDWASVMMMLEQRASCYERSGKDVPSMHLQILKCQVREWRVKEIVKEGWVQDGMLEWDGDEGEDEEGEETY